MSGLSIFFPKTTSGVTFFWQGKDASTQEPFLETVRKTLIVMLISLAVIGSIFNMAAALQFLATGSLTPGGVYSQFAFALVMSVVTAVVSTVVDRYFRK